MHKDYKIWMDVKARVNNSAGKPPLYYEREIWLCSIGENVGHENDGKGTTFTRPVLVIRGYSQHFCHIIPLSTTKNRGIFYFPFNGHTGKVSVAILSQSRAVSTSRLHEKIGYISKADFKALKEQLRKILKL